MSKQGQQSRTYPDASLLLGSVGAGIPDESSNSIIHDLPPRDVVKSLRKYLDEYDTKESVQLSFDL